MKVIILKKATIKKSMLLCVFVITVSLLTTSFGIQSYYNVDFTTGLVTGNNVNLRSGPGINYSVVAQVKKNEYIRVFAGIGDWYVVQVDDNHVGVISKQYVKPIYPNSNNTGGSGSSSGSGTGTGSGAGSNTSGSNSNTTTELTADELEVFNLINEQRKNNRYSSIKNRF